VKGGIKMSGVSDVADCPCCRSEKSMMVSSDWKPHDCVNGVCLVCGYEYWTELGFTNKEYLEELRHDYDFKESTEITEEKKKHIEEYCTNVGIKNLIKLERGD
jgi:rubredoxin